MTTDDRQQIETLIRRWAEAVHTGDLDTVLADHDDAIVMFDVPPPHDGVRGIEAYRDTWPPFFEWQGQGATFDITELDVTAGHDVAFAHALLRCNTPGHHARYPEHRLRLTIGLRKEHGRWLVTHEHHSFPCADEATSETEIRALHDEWFAAAADKDLDTLMAPIAEEIVSYEHDGPLEVVGIDGVLKVCEEGLDASAEIEWDVPELRITTSEDLAVAWGLNRIRTNDETETWSRGTRVFRKVDGAWTMIHQHLSHPHTAQG